MSLDKRFWDGTRWDGHAAFDTISHTHVACYSPAEGRDTCDVMVVECRDGRWYVEDNWGGDAKGAPGVWNPFDPADGGPCFFASEDAAIRHAVSVVAAISGASEAEMLKNFLEEEDAPSADHPPSIALEPTAEIALFSFNEVPQTAGARWFVKHGETVERTRGFRSKLDASEWIKDLGHRVDWRAGYTFRLRGDSVDMQIVDSKGKVAVP